MTCHQYFAIGPDGTVLKVIKIGSINDIKIAYAKLKARFSEKNLCFVKLQYAGTWTL